MHKNNNSVKVLTKDVKFETKIINVLSLTKLLLNVLLKIISTLKTYGIAYCMF